MPYRALLRLLAALLVVCPCASAEDAPKRLRVAPDGSGSAAVVVSLDAPLVHTTQVFPVDATGRPVPEGRQVEAVLDRLDAALHAAGSDLSRAVRLHVVLAREGWRDAIRAEVAKRLDGRDGPAWTFVGGETPMPGALVAVDAVATTAAAPAADAAPRPVVAGFPGSSATFAVLPAGPRVFISGQAEPDADLAEATRKTLLSLGDSLRTLGLGPEHVVQLKAFVQPADRADLIAREAAAFFGGTAPPLVVVGWKSAASQPIEIEVIATSPRAVEADRVAFPPLPPLKPSPVFSRSARVNSGSLVYVSGLSGPEGAAGPEQVRVAFESLRSVVEEAGADFRHLAKATYYVADPEADAALGAIRPTLYDPSRPPAASKAVVPGVAAPGRGFAMDMIAVAP